MTGNFDAGMIETSEVAESVSEKFNRIEAGEPIWVEFFGHWFDDRDFDWGFYGWLERQHGI